MARRQSSGSAGASLDSLLDTLTNVVGILIIILIVTQLSASQAVERIKGFVEEISEEQYSQKLAEAEQLRQLLDEQKLKELELAAITPQKQLSIEEQQKLAAELKDRMTQLTSKTVDEATLRKELEDRRQKTAKIEEQLASQQKMIATLKARLADTPAAGPALDAKVVNLPDPREAPKGAKPVVFVCRDGVVFPIDSTTLQNEARDIVNAGMRSLNKEGLIDCEKLTELFEKKTVGDKYVRLGIRIGGDAKPYLLINRREDEGESTDRITRRTSQFNKWLSQLNPQQHYIEFRVWSDSFDTYLVARNEAARNGFTAGWIPYAVGQEYWISFGSDLKTTCFGRTPAAAGPPPDPNQPPPPPDNVD
ncbi:MAG: hypothetical protein R3C01_11685 [Planctomycetaceae bacterium]